MALKAGYSIGWEGVSNDAMKRACIDGLEGNPSTMKRLLKVYLNPAPEELKKTWERLADPTEECFHSQGKSEGSQSQTLW